MGILVLAMFVGVSMAMRNGDENGKGDCDRLRDGSCDVCGDCDRDGDGYCDWCGYDLLYDEDGDCEPPQDGSGDKNQNGGHANDEHNGAEDGDGEQNGRD